VSSVGIFFIVEPGRLEQQAHILVRTLRKFGNLSTNHVLHAFQPRTSGTISKSTKEFFEKNNVIFEKINLNKKFFFYPLANKILVGDYFEKKFSYDRNLFLDTDLIIYDSINYLFQNDKKIAIAPVHQKGIGIGSDEISEIWKIIFEILDIKIRDTWQVKSLIDQKTLAHYFNTGVISYQSSRSIFKHTKSYLERVMKDSRVLKLPYSDFYFIEQILLSCVIAKTFKKEEIDLLPIEYNYPIELTAEKIDASKIIHFQDYFENNGLSAVLQKVAEIIHDLDKGSKKKHWWVRFREILSYQLFKLSFIAK